MIAFLYNIFLCVSSVRYDFEQDLGFGSVGSARFWLPGSRSAKTCGSTDPDPRGKISTKNFFTPKTQIQTFEKKRDYKNSNF